MKKLMVILVLLLLPFAAFAEEEKPFVNPVYSKEFIETQERKLAMVPVLFPYTYKEADPGTKQEDSELRFSSSGEEKEEPDSEQEDELEQFDGFTFRTHVINTTRRELTITADTVSNSDKYNRGWDLYNTVKASMNFYMGMEIQCVRQDENSLAWFWFQYSDLCRVGDENRRAAEIVFPSVIDTYFTTPEGRVYTTYYDLSKEYSMDDQTHVLEIIRYRGYTSCYIDHHFITGFEDGFSGYFSPLYGVGLSEGGKEAVFITDNFVKAVPNAGFNKPVEGNFLYMRGR